MPVKNNIQVHAGHGLNLLNLSNICRISQIEELNIGHSVVMDSIFKGFKKLFKIFGKQLIMIKGIGIDLVDKYRFKKIIQQYGNKFAHKILSRSEYVEYEDISNKESFLSKRFAAKEALSKAIGCGLYRNGIYPKSYFYTT